MASPLGDRLAAARRAAGLSQADVARRWGVSKSMVSKIERGIKPGRNYAASVHALERGIVTEPPARRRTASGELARVRRPAGMASTPPTPVPVAPARGAFGVQEGVTRTGARVVVVTAPKTPGPGRESARQAILDDMRRAARGGRARGGRGQRVVIEVRAGDRSYTIGAKGGYDPSTVLRGMRGEADDPFAWLSDTLDGIGYDVPAGSINRVTISYL